HSPTPPPTTGPEPAGRRSRRRPCTTSVPCAQRARSDRAAHLPATPSRTAAVRHPPVRRAYPAGVPADDVPALAEVLEAAHVVALPMRVRFRGVTEREAVLLAGPCGW